MQESLTNDAGAASNTTPRDVPQPPWARIPGALRRARAIAWAPFRRNADALPAVATLVFAVAFVVQAHLVFIRPFPVSVNVDEDYLNAFAIRMIEGRFLPYVDAVSHRGPLLYWVMAIVAKAFGWQSWMPMRLLSLTVNVAVTILAFVAGWLGRRPLAGAIASLAIPLVTCGAMAPLDGIGFNGEPLLNLFVVSAFIALLFAMDRRRALPSYRWLAVGGFLAACGALSKQVGITHVIPFALWLGASALARRNLSRRQRVGIPFWFGAGVAIPFALLLLRYAVAGELRTLVYWMVTYNRDVYMSPYTPKAIADGIRSLLFDRLILFAVAVPVLFWGIARPVASARSVEHWLERYDTDPFGPTVALSALAGLFGAQAAMRGWGHYFVQAVPWCGLVLGVTVTDALRLARTSPLAGQLVAQILVLMPAVGLTAFGTDRFVHGQLAGRPGWRVPQQDSVCVMLQKETRPDDYLFIWGFRPAFYTSCARRPASRYVFTTMVAGIVPWFSGASKAEDDRLSAPGSRDLLIADLEKTKPPIIIDWPDSIGDRPMKRYEKLAAYLKANYCSLKVAGGVETYGRRKPDGSCPTLHE